MTLFENPHPLLGNGTDLLAETPRPPVAVKSPSGDSDRYGTIAVKGRAQRWGWERGAFWLAKPT